MPGRKASRARREAVLKRAVEMGDDQAAAEAGVTVATLKRWRDESASAEPAGAEHGDVDQAPSEPETPRPLDDIERMRKAAEAARIVATRAIRRTDELLTAGRASDARNAAVAGGVWADKAAKWDQFIVDAEARRGREQTRLTEENARLIADVITGLLTALDVPMTEPAKRILRTLMLQAGRGEQLAPSPADVEAARAVDRAITPARREPLQLPPGRPAHPDGDDAERQERAQRDPLAAPKRVVRAVKESAHKRADTAQKPKPARPSKKRSRPGVSEHPVRMADGRVDVFRIDERTGELIDPEVPNYE